MSIEAKKAAEGAPPSEAEQELARLRAELEEKKALLNDAREKEKQLLGLASNAHAAPAPTAPKSSGPDYQLFNEDEITEGMSRAELADILNKKTVHNAQAAAKAAVEEFKKNQFDPFVADGISNLAEMRYNTTRDGIPYIEDFEDEIKQTLASLPGELRASSQGLQIATRQVLGDPANIKKIVEKEVASMRQQILDEGGLIDGGTQSTTTIHEDLTPESLLKNQFIDREGLRLIKQAGSLDEFANKASRGRKNWNRFAKDLIKAHGGTVPEVDDDE